MKRQKSLIMPKGFRASGVASGIKKGNPNQKIKKSKNKIKGNFTTGSQEHFYLEGQVAFVIPKEDDNYTVYSSTQHPSEKQKII